MNAAAASSAAPLSSAAQPAAASAKRGHAALWTVAAIVLLAIAAGAWWFFSRQPWPLTDITLKQLTDSGDIQRIAMSPDGKTLAEVKNDKGQQSLWIRNIPTNVDTQVIPPSGQGFVDVTFSADGNMIYFSAEPPDSRYIRTLYRVSLLGGTPQALIHDADSSASFSPDGSRFVFLRQTPQSTDHFAEMHIINADLSGDQIFYKGLGATSFPRWSRDGKSILWDEVTANGAGRFGVGNVATGAVRFFAEPQGKLFQRWEDSLPGHFSMTVATTRESDAGQVLTVSTADGSSHSVTNDLTSYAQPSSSADGKEVGVIAAEIKSTLTIFNVGDPVPKRTLDLRISPARIQWVTGDTMLLTSVARSNLLNLDTQAITPLSFGGVQTTSSASVCPDGKVVFAGVPKGVNHSVLYSVQQNGERLQQLTTDGPVRTPRCVDGNIIFYAIPVPNTSGTSIWILRPGGSPTRLDINTEAFGFAQSQDGKWVGLGKGVNEELFLERYDITAPTKKPSRTRVDLSMTLVYVDFLPDDSGIVYAAMNNGQQYLQGQKFDDSSPFKMSDTSPVPILSASFSPDGKQIAVLRRSTTSNVAIIQEQGAR